MGSSINDYSIHALERIENDRAAQEQAELSIEFLQGLIRQSLAEFIAAMFPQTAYRQALKLVHRSVTLRTPTLGVDTLTIAEDVLADTSPEWRKRIKETSGRLFACTEKTIAGFLLHLEKKRTAALSATSILTTAAIDLEVLERYGASRDIIEDTVSSDTPVSKALSVPLNGRTWSVSIKGYPGGDLKAFSKKEAMLVAVKKKIEFLQHDLTPRLRDMAGEVKRRGPASALSFEVKPFLKGASEKFKFVESLAQNTFTRMSANDLTETASEQMLQALDLELQALERYIYKLELIFSKAARRPFTVEDIGKTEGMKLSPEDTSLLGDLLGNGAGGEDGRTADSILHVLGDIDMNEPAQMSERTYDRDIDWTIRERPTDPGILQESTATITEKKARPVQDTQKKRMNLFAKLFGTLLDPGRTLEPTTHSVVTTDGTARGQRQKKNQAGSIDVLLPAIENTSRQQVHKRRVYHHFGMF